MSFGDFHPLVIHFPIALFGASFFFDVLHLRWKHQGFPVAAHWNLRLALLASVAAASTGFAADRLVGHFIWPFVPWKTHGFLQLLALAVFVAVWVWEIRQHKTPRQPLPPFWIGLKGLAVAILYYGSHLGAVLADRI
ncbi:MAG: DUF2231 domain-containing protein [Candidatus Neomarinimicrobiota bacterium]|nr:MAG: DUF2231 domain-containing protein [Candidatus Neomarinimicrobiota bacterium]